MLYPKLKEENQKLWEKVFAMEKEIEDLKFQVSSSDVIISGIAISNRDVSNRDVPVFAQKHKN